MSVTIATLPREVLDVLDARADEPAVPTAGLRDEPPDLSDHGTLERMARIVSLADELCRITLPERPKEALDRVERYFGTRIRGPAEASVVLAQSRGRYLSSRKTQLVRVLADLPPPGGARA